MDRLDRVIAAFGFNIVEGIPNKEKLFVGKATVNFDIRAPKAVDVYASSGYNQYLKVGQIISTIIRDESNRLIPHLNVILEKPQYIERQYWWQKD